MKVKKTDFMYRNYERFYTLSGETVPPPVNLCRFFWISIFGLLGRIYFEFNYFLVLLLWGGYVVSLGLVTSSLVGQDLPVIHAICSTFFMLLIIGLISMIAVRPITKFTGWLERTLGESVCNKLFATFGFAFLVTIFGMGIYTFLQQEIIDWDKFWAKLCEFGMIVGVTTASVLAFAVFCVYVIYPIATTEFFKICFQYLKAKKQKICPLIEVSE